MKFDRRTKISIAVAVAALLGLLLTRSSFEPSGTVPERPTPVHTVDAPAPQPAPQALPQQAAAVPVPAMPEAPAGMTRTELPKLGTNAKKRLWVRGTFGKREDQFGKMITEGETLPPQGFVPTADGRLLVLDTGKHRLIWYGADGKLEKSTPLPKDSIVIPADVAVTKDGTVAVIDYPGLQTNGTVLLDAQGNKKAVMPQLKDQLLSGMYAVGDDLFINTDGMSSVKLGNTKGIPDDIAPGVPQEEDGRIPGHLTPDGTTVLRLNIESEETGDFSISAMRGSPAQEVFTRFYRYPGISTIPFLQADAAGRIYMVITFLGRSALVCLDGKTGDPVGMVQMPVFGGVGGTQLRTFNVIPQGGLVYGEATESDLTFEVFDCHP